MGLPNASGILKSQVIVDVAIQIELVLLDELHHGGPREQFGHRSDTHNGLPWVHRNLARDVGIAIAFFQQYGAILDYH